ncbi:MAG TPA: FGGY family carbohydrate kinase [Tepidisphaeraceae bacterium]|nr:FGGY family carbohydrate kinase [Tepidisphaeraceae bacterium]
MTVLAIDIGSSSVKAGVLRGDQLVGNVARRSFDTLYDGVRAEVKPDDIVGAIRRAVGDLGAAAKRADVIALSVMSPAWVAMDRSGKAITPIVTHQDRRSVEIAREIEKRVGGERHLLLAGNRPFPGSIGSTTWGWYLRHERARMRRADLVGLLNTFIHRRLTGARVIDPSNASFTGVYETTTLGGWSDALCDGVEIPQNVLPTILDANQVAGTVTAAGARRFGVTQGTPVLTGLIDGSAAMLLAGVRRGQLVNTVGSTDVLALCTDRPKPHEQLLTRALGVGRWWMSVGTVAASGSALNWCRQTFFADCSEADFWQRVAAASAKREQTDLRFEPYLAGERTSIQQRRGALLGLTLATSRDDILRGVVDALARASAARLPLLRSRGVPLRREVVVSGGVQKGLDKVLHRDWPGRWNFRVEQQATLRGLGTLTPVER